MLVSICVSVCVWLSACACVHGCSNWKSTEPTVAFHVRSADRECLRCDEGDRECLRCDEGGRECLRCDEGVDLGSSCITPDAVANIHACFLSVCVCVYVCVCVVCGENRTQPELCVRITM